MFYLLKGDYTYYRLLHETLAWILTDLTPRNPKCVLKYPVKAVEPELRSTEMVHAEAFRTQMASRRVAPNMKANPLSQC